MNRSFFSAFAVAARVPLDAEAWSPAIQGGSMIVRGDNRFGGAKQQEGTPAFGLALAALIRDEEHGTAATARSSATYNLTLADSVATFSISLEQNFSLSSSAFSMPRSATAGRRCWSC